jgi:tRNA A-37 threonylcarbamoyl transferase component Bud32
MIVTGTRLGPYEIVSSLGAGGMGEVYRARDTKLNRNIAIKILLPAVANDPDRLARFSREAQVLASLNHPNIAHIHGLEESDDMRALVMELVEGPTLAERLERSTMSQQPGGGLPLDEALHIARQLADALEAAHEQGIIHRDLKPANIKVREDGTVKVLDFGLAKAIDPASTASVNTTMSPTVSMQATQAGTILGTAAYMSPEQAAGRSVDRRSDLWAFGVVLMEMLSGRRVFDGETLSHVLASVLKDEPDWTTLPPNTPAPIRRLLRRCLEKDRKRRLDSAAAARCEIDDALATPSSDANLANLTISASPPAQWRRVLPWTVGALTAVVAVLATWVVMRPAPPAAPQISRFAIVPAAAQALVFAYGAARDLALSLDGSRLVYTAGSPPELMVRAIDQLDAVPLAGILPAFSPFLSPDGRWIGFFAGPAGELKKVSITGGPPTSVCRLTGELRGASWGADDTIVLATEDRSTGLLRVPAGGGEPTVLTTPDLAKGEQDHVFPSVLPGGRGVLFTITAAGGAASAQVAVLDLQTGQRKTLIRGGSQAEYVDPWATSAGSTQGGSAHSGYLVYASAGTLRAVRFDLASLDVLSDPVTVVDQVMVHASGAANFSISRSGTLLYAPGVAGAQTGAARSLVWVNRQGYEEPIPAPARAYVHPRLSPDGTRVALAIVDREHDIWIWDLARQTLTSLTFGPADEAFPVWTPDGRRLIFSSTRGGAGNIYWQPADGTGAVERLTTSPNQQYPSSISPDGNNLVFQENFPKTAADLMLLSMAPPARSEPFLQTTFSENNAEVSPDGHWLAYQSNESNQNEIYVRPFPTVDDRRWLVSVGGGTKPLWARSGRELFFLNGGSLLSVSIQTAPAFSAGNPTKVFEGRYFTGIAGRTYDVSRDGQRFLMIKNRTTTDDKTTPASMVVVLNWTEELKAKVPAK